MMEQAARERFPVRRIVAFLLVFAVLFAGVTWMISFHPDHRIYRMIGGFYREPEDTLQAVYIGASNCYAFWNELYAWKQYGIAVYAYACGNLPFAATEYIMKAVRRTQPNARFIVNVNAVENDDMEVKTLHNLLDYMPWSREKVEMLNGLCDMLGFSALDRLEFYFPWLRLRSDMLTILYKGVFPKDDGLKGAPAYGWYLNRIMDITDKYHNSDIQAPLPQSFADSAERLLDYCDAEDVDVVFVTVPRAEDNLEALQNINAMNALIAARGYDVLDLRDKTGDMHLDLDQDYYNRKHTNIHGSVKLTGYLSEYLIGRFGLEDLRGDARYASWDEAWEKYEGIAFRTLAELELDLSKRDFTLERPEALTAAGDADSGDVTLSWEGEADGWLVLGRAGSKHPIVELARLDRDARTFTDRGKPGRKRTYFVVPLRERGGDIYYGNYAYAGTAADWSGQGT